MKIKLKNPRRFVLAIVSIVFSVSALCLCINIIKYPEKYITTWKYQLQQDLKKGDEAAQKYYAENYIKKGEKLF